MQNGSQNIFESDKGQILNFYTFAPARYKWALLAASSIGFFNSCANWNLFHSSSEKAKRILENNKYPNWFYDKVFHDTLEKLIRKEKPKDELVLDEQVTGKRLFYLQYRGFETIKFIKISGESWISNKTNFGNEKIKDRFTKLKAPIDKNFASNVVYKLTCTGCMSSYIDLPPDISLVGRRRTRGKEVCLESISVIVKKISTENWKRRS